MLSIRRVGPPTRPRCCARARWPSPARNTPPPPRCAPALLRAWPRLFAALHHVPLPKPAAGHWPEGVSAVELASPAASAVVITNASRKLFRDDLRVVEPVT